ncbi:MAG TPA: CpsD/CapB family tyrosine-protein kinase [Gracilimonas sp.]|uniref:tyrosine-protein kinase family protein n=1 Tax=Gracilimonas sp. TaxID=1974203 RepID=UPI002DA773EC|nr:CpsD/CapB family tyrosine-protein kinase [Gracilimonas sp.]
MSDHIENKSLERVKKSIWKPDHSLMPITIDENRSTYVDSSIVHQKYYNNFNYSKLPQEYKKPNLTLGVTSARSGEGKTHIAANLATSFAVGYQKNTVLIDLNIKNPSIHKIFDIDPKPGLSEALKNKEIRLVQSSHDHLFLLPIGDVNDYSLGLSDILAVRDMICTLEEQFDFVVVDMSPILPITDFPVLFANEVDGLITVIDTTRTKHSDVNEIFRHINKDQVTGFIFNRMEVAK